MDEICEGVRELVRRLREEGFRTCDSGDGSHHAAGMECARPYPHVTMEVDPETAIAEAQRLYELVQSWDVPVYPIGTTDDLDRPCAAIQLSYDPALAAQRGAACMDLMHVNDAFLRAAERGDWGDPP